eukprot:236671-Prorocentrum_minimum.AAC.2
MLSSPLRLVCSPRVRCRRRAVAVRCGRVDTVALSLTLRRRGDLTLGHPGAALGFGCAGGGVTLGYLGAALGFGCAGGGMALGCPGAALGFGCDGGDLTRGARVWVRPPGSPSSDQWTGPARICRAEGGRRGVRGASDWWQCPASYRFLDGDQRGDRGGLDDVIGSLDPRISAYQRGAAKAAPHEKWTDGASAGSAAQQNQIVERPEIDLAGSVV